MRKSCEEWWAVGMMCWWKIPEAESWFSVSSLQAIISSQSSLVTYILSGLWSSSSPESLVTVILDCDSWLMIWMFLYCWQDFWFAVVIWRRYIEKSVHRYLHLFKLFPLPLIAIVCSYVGCHSAIQLTSTLVSSPSNLHNETASVFW